MATKTLQQFSVKRTGEQDVFSFDFKDVLATGEILTGTPTYTVSISTETDVPDASPSALLLGGASITGAITNQTMIDGVDGALYVVSVSVGTDNSRTLEARALLLVKDSTF